MKQQTVPKFRQGDVMFAACAALPRGERKERKDGSVAYGEVTGHTHTVMTADTANVFEIDGAVHLVVNDRGVSIQGDIDRISPALAAMLADSSETAERRKLASELMAALPTAGAIFTHGTIGERELHPVPLKTEDRHFPVALPPGNYSAIVQREYSPEAIRNVID